MKWGCRAEAAELLVELLRPVDMGLREVQTRQTYANAKKILGEFGARKCCSSQTWRKLTDNLVVIIARQVGIDFRLLQVLMP